MSDDRFFGLVVIGAILAPLVLFGYVVTRPEPPDPMLIECLAAHKDYVPVTLPNGATAYSCVSPKASTP